MASGGRREKRRGRRKGGEGGNHNRGVARRGYYKDCAWRVGVPGNQETTKRRPCILYVYTHINLAHVRDYGIVFYFHCYDPLPVIDCIISLSTSSARLPRPTEELRSDAHSTLSVGLVG